MNQWIAVGGTLLGTLLGGVISYFTMQISTKNERRVISRKLAEERAIWATERELESLQKFYGTIEKLILAAMEYRIRRAHETHHPDSIPSWVKRADEARAGIEDALSSSHDEVYLLRTGIYESFKSATKPWSDYFLETDSEKALEHLMRLETSLSMFKKDVATEIRRIFEARRSGADIK